MSVLHPHIKALRAEAAQLRRIDAIIAEERPNEVGAAMTGAILLSLAEAKERAADALAAEERERQARVSTIPTAPSQGH
jgi:hypothetical protein